VMGLAPGPDRSGHQGDKSTLWRRGIDPEATRRSTDVITSIVVIVPCLVTISIALRATSEEKQGSHRKNAYFIDGFVNADAKDKLRMPSI